MNKKELVFTAITDVFIKRDINAFDKYFSDEYIQHNPTLPNGTAFLKEFIPTLTDVFSYEPGIITENEDFVMIHGRYVGWGPNPMIGVDIFKVENGKITEHWDVLQEEVTAENSANGNAMFPIKSNQK